MSRLTRALTLSVALGCAVTPAAHAAPPRFGAPLVLNPPSTDSVGRPAVAVASGRVAVAWEQETGDRAARVLVRRGTTSGRFGAVQRVGTTGSLGQPSVAVGRRGGAAVIWDDGGGVEAAVARGRGRFGRPRALATAAAGISVKVLAAGERYVALFQLGYKGPIHYAVSDAAGRFGRTRTLERATGSLSGLSAAADPAGAVIAAWGTRAVPGGHQNQQVGFARLAPGARTFGTPAVVRAAAADQGAEADDVTVAAGPGGAVLGWVESYAHQAPAMLRVAGLGAVRPAPETVSSLSSDNIGKRYFATPAPSVPGGGLPRVVAWEVDTTRVDFGEIGAAHVFAAERRPDGTYGDPVQISGPDTFAEHPVAAATRSAAVVAWTTELAGPGVYGLQYAVRDGAGPFGPARAVTPGHTNRDVVLASSPGAVVAAWTTPSRHVSAAILR